MVVRDAMLKAGVLSPSYKFKAMALGPQGGNFYVMIDLSRDYGGEMDLQKHIEAAISTSAKRHFEINVRAVYWRINPDVAVGIRPKAQASQSAIGKPQAMKSHVGHAAAVNRSAFVRPVDPHDSGSTALGATQYGDL